MRADTLVAGTTDQEAGLVDWFLGLTPAQRLAELESRIHFLAQARTDEQLRSNRRDTGAPPG